MKRKILCLLLTLTLLLGTMTAFAEETSAEITVYVTVSRYGEIVEDADGNVMCQVPVTLEGKSVYIIDDALRLLHENCYPGEESGYASSEGKWGLGIDILWGDTSYNFGYQVNSGSESVMGLDHIIENGDYIDAYIYENDEEFESYSYFDLNNAEIFLDESVELQLFYANGYDEQWNPIYSPCEDAIVTINGEESSFVTDTDGKATLSFDAEGTYVISAKKTKIVDDKTVTAIIAPSCIIKTKMLPEFKIMHNIAKAYSESDFSLDESNLPWIVADMISYEKLFPESENCFSEERKAEARDSIIDAYSDATRPGDLAKTIIALRSLGYDARNVYTKDFVMIDFVERLTDLVDAQDEEVTNVFRLPYVILALTQAEDYATDEQLQWLVNEAIGKKDIWMDVTEGTDALAPMIMALSPYCTDIIEDAIEILKGEQREDGLIDGYESYEAASTGLALCALSASGIDASEVVKRENSLIDGLISTADSDLSNFPNAFATEQGFRGLLAWKLLTQENERIYDFSDYPMEEANVTGAKFCPVVFKVSPSDATVNVNGTEALHGNTFDLSEGTYNYTVSAAGYYGKAGTIEITADDVLSRTAKVVELSLTASGGGGSSGGGTDKNDEKEEEKEEIKEEEKPSSVETIFSDISKDDWHYDAVSYVYNKKLFTGTGEKFEPEKQMTRGMLVTVLYRLAAPTENGSDLTFADVSPDAWYTEGVKWAAANNIIMGISESEFSPDTDVTREQLAVILYRYVLMLDGEVKNNGKELNSFNDTESISAYAKEAMEYMVQSGIINGKGERLLCPADNATRAEVATMIMRFAEVINK